MYSYKSLCFSDIYDGHNGNQYNCIISLLYCIHCLVFVIILQIISLIWSNFIASKFYWKLEISACLSTTSWWKDCFFAEKSNKFIQLFDKYKFYFAIISYCCDQDCSIQHWTIADDLHYRKWMSLCRQINVVKYLFGRFSAMK